MSKIRKTARTYQSRHQVFGELEITLQIEGSNSKYNKSSLTIKNVCGCYPFVVHTNEHTSMETDKIEIELDGGGEETSLLECLIDITDKLKKDGWVSQKDIEKQES